MKDEQKIKDTLYGGQQFNCTRVAVFNVVTQVQFKRFSNLGVICFVAPYRREKSDFSTLENYNLDGLTNIVSIDQSIELYRQKKIDAITFIDTHSTSHGYKLLCDSVQIYQSAGVQELYELIEYHDDIITMQVCFAQNFIRSMRMKLL